MKIVILAAGIGSRLGNPYPKPLTTLKNGKKILEHQIGNLTGYFNKDDIMVVVGFKKDLIMEEQPDLLFIYNPDFDQTNTSKSLLRALYKCKNESVLWLNGDVVFEPEMLKKMIKTIERGQSFIAVNNSVVGEEEVKYSLSGEGFIKEISKQVVNAPGEAVGINYIASGHISSFIQSLEQCEPNDYFEKGLELSIKRDGIDIIPVDISEFKCVEVDFREDLDTANTIF
ncbi:MAG TPA: phosphocholine cytidylyltransferase family protein [Bacteroidales bacterium]|nr:phosphocholine cytidylyltransferase family protein [Bacteroidales bacterium]